MVRYAAFIALVSTAAAAANAGDKPIQSAVPAWVKPAPAIDPAKLTGDSPALLLYDNQQRIEDGQVWSYTDTATRAASAEVLGAIGTIQLPWQPAHGDLIVHRAEIIRGADHIDLLKGGKIFTVLHREQALDRRALDGLLTATMPVEGLAIGDVLHLTFSVTSRDPTLKGNVQTIAPVFFDPFRVQFARVRLLWPEKSDIRWKAYADTIAIKPIVKDGFREVVLTLPLAKQPEIPKDAPGRFQRLPIVEASSFTDWASVAAVMAPLYRTEGLIAPNSAIAAEVARIMAAESDPLRRTAMALQLVQDKIRYLLIGMDSGNYVPQTPAQTWALRYGDCKAKTLLLLALLHAMKIEAEPVLVNSKFGDLVPNRLPDPASFDHILVRATIAGETLWLDGTASGTRLADIHDTPAFGYMLPVRAAGAAPSAIALHADARPGIATTIEFDESAGVNLPAPFRIAMAVRGGSVESLRAAAAQGSKDDLQNLAETVIKQYVDNATVSTHAIAFDDAQGVATLEATGLSYPDWFRNAGRLETSLDKTVAGIAFAPDRGRPAWRDIPVATGTPSHYTVTTRIRLPGGGTGFTLDGDQPLSGMLGGVKVDRTVTKAGDWVTIDSRFRSSGEEIAAAAIPEARRRLALANARPPKAIAPANEPAFWQTVESAKKGHRLDPILAVFARRIADKPDEATRYTDRAWFLERTFSRTEAIADLTRAIAIAPDADTYLKRAGLYKQLGDKAKALADAAAAHQIDPASNAALRELASLQAERGDRAGAVSLLQERIDAGGDGKDDFLAAKAEIEADAGDKNAAIATIDAAIAQSPGKPDLLNSRCWVKGTLNIALDTALKDCTKAIELSNSPVAALDSRAMVYFRLNRFDDALSDLDSALTSDPDQAASMFMRGIIRKRSGDAKAGDADIVAARMISPRIDETYRKYGIAP